MGISFSLNKIINYTNENKPIQARACSLLLPFSELIQTTTYLTLATMGLPVSIIKLPLSLYSFIENSPNSQAANWHKDLPGLKDVGQMALKAAVCFINIIVAPLLNLISPLANLKYHEECGIISSNKKDLSTPKKPLLVSERKSFSNMAGMEDLKEKLQEVINSWLEPDQNYKDYNIPRTNGVLFYGPPGTGKSLAAECLAGEMNLPFLKISPAELSSEYVNQSVKKVHQLFEGLKKQGGGIVFFDEMEALAPTRSNKDSITASENNKVVTELLTQLQDAKNHRILVIGATNHLDHIDSALIREGRFDLKIEIPLPDLTARAVLLKHYISTCLKREEISDTFYRQVAEKLLNFSASKIELFSRKCRLKAMKDNLSFLKEEHILAVLKEEKLTT